MPELGFNIDHVATLREARYRDWKRGLAPEPNLLETARVAERAGVDQLTVHLREDRRHIQPADVRELAAATFLPLNLEMAANPVMLKQALNFAPQEVCLVPENRLEVTTEGGLDVQADWRRLKTISQKLQAAKIVVSAFIDPDLSQIEGAARLGIECVELHTGAYANTLAPRLKMKEISRHARAAVFAHNLGLRVNAGHGLHYSNVREYIEDVPHLHTLNIGHAIVARAIFVGLPQALREMQLLIRAPEPAQMVD